MNDHDQLQAFFCRYFLRILRNLRLVPSKVLDILSLAYQKDGYAAFRFEQQGIFFDLQFAIQRNVQRRI
jgi:hypothetical protein